MSQLKLTYATLKIVSRRTRPSFGESEDRSKNSSPLPSIATKAAELHRLRPGAAAVIEGMIEELILEAGGRKL